MTIVPMTPGDASLVSRIYAASWRTAYRGIVPQEYLDSLDPDYWTPFFGEPGRVGFVLRVDGREVGAACVAPSRDHSLSGWGELISIYLLPEYWGKGYGGQLFAHALGALGEMGFRDVYLWVLEENAAARRFYERNGFTATWHQARFTIGGKELTEIRYVGSFQRPQPSTEKEGAR